MSLVMLKRKDKEIRFLKDNCKHLEQENKRLQEKIKELTKVVGDKKWLEVQKEVN